MSVNTSTATRKGRKRCISESSSEESSNEDALPQQTELKAPPPQTYVSPFAHLKFKKNKKIKTTGEDTVAATSTPSEPPVPASSSVVPSSVAPADQRKTSLPGRPTTPASGRENRPVTPTPSVAEPRSTTLARTPRKRVSSTIKLESGSPKKTLSPKKSAPTTAGRRKSLTLSTVENHSSPGVQPTKSAKGTDSSISPGARNNAARTAVASKSNDSIPTTVPALQASSSSFNFTSSVAKPKSSAASRPRPKAKREAALFVPSGSKSSQLPMKSAEPARSSVKPGVPRGNPAREDALAKYDPKRRLPKH
ncbi:hypothetical protein PENSPDRAFT_749393 [Peniophora sp. CONT]|nr:hypothetical protein PENSPDRAFT_749393 [Peniophora sp. CONT]